MLSQLRPLVENNTLNNIDRWNLQNDLFAICISGNENISKNHRINFNFRERSKKLSSYGLKGNVRTNENNRKNDYFSERYNGDEELDRENIGNTISKNSSSTGSINGNYVQRFSENSKRNILLRGGIGANSNESTSANNQFTKFKISNPDNSFDKNKKLLKKNKTRILIGIY